MALKTKLLRSRIEGLDQCTPLAHRSSNRRGAVTAPKIAPEGAADTLWFQCPNTNREVDSGISARGAGLISIRVLCPLCEDLHEWQVTGRNLDAVLSVKDRSNDIRLNKAQKGPPVFHSQNPELIELREQLLEEMNHRLKNNLQVLYGLPKVARRKTDNAETRVVLLDTCRCIGPWVRRKRCFTPSTVRPMSAGEDSSKRSVAMPERSSAKTFRSSTTRAPGLYRRRRQYPLHSF
jgi:hypothetical protein